MFVLFVASVVVIGFLIQSPTFFVGKGLGRKIEMPLLWLDMGLSCINKHLYVELPSALAVLYIWSIYSENPSNMTVVGQIAFYFSTLFFISMLSFRNSSRDYPSARSESLKGVPFLLRWKFPKTAPVAFTVSMMLFRLSSITLIGIFIDKLPLK